MALFTLKVVLALPWGHHAVLMEKVKNAHIDLLFYHLKLRCYVVIELKRGPSSRNTQAK